VQSVWLCRLFDRVHTCRKAIEKEVIMFELFAMSLREYWNEVEDGGNVEDSIAELQGCLSEHFGKEVSWEEPEADPSRKDEEIAVDVIDDCQLSAVHAVAAKLELDGNLDGFELDTEEPWNSPIFERLAEEIEDEASDGELEKFCHLLSIGNSAECIAIPVDLPFVAQININNDDDNDDDEEEEHHCDCGEDECCCEDEDSIDISSLQALRRELDVIADALKIDKSKDIETVDFDDADMFRHAKIGWYIMSAKVDEAIDQKLPLIMRFVDDEEYDDLDEDEDLE